MKIIFITTSNDYSTTKIIDWVINLATISMLRINTDKTRFPSPTINSEDQEFYVFFRKFSSLKITTDKINQYWRKELIEYWKEFLLLFPFRVSQINRDDVQKLDARFYPTFFQEMIPRDYEVRLFYLKGKCWAMAFIVKKENEISPDIWNIMKRREVPINVPLDIQEKTRKFMDKAGYNTGSLDFIIHGEDWYFLELNPSGQYDFVSKNCNYFLDREIAKTLIDESERRT